MRIIGYIQHPQLKITAFSLNNRTAVKFEVGAYEVVYKFGDGIADTFHELERLVDEKFIAEVFETFDKMHKTTGEGIERFLKKEGRMKNK